VDELASGELGKCAAFDGGEHGICKLMSLLRGGIAVAEPSCSGLRPREGLGACARRAGVFSQSRLQWNARNGSFPAHDIDDALRIEDSGGTG
jgi:hypothetical protein